MNRTLPIILCLIATLLLHAGGALLQAAQATKQNKPAEPVEPASCVTAECHPQVKQFATLHAPVHSNACDTCHELIDVKQHTYQLKSKEKALCTFCHEFDVEGIPVVHTPVAKGECLGCHSPHGGPDTKFLREGTVSKMCRSCHEDVVNGNKHIHKPVAEGTCESCHTSHASRFPKLLYAEGEALCLSCHQDFQVGLAKAKFQHGAMKEGCTSCHTAHASPVAKQLKQPIGELCTTACHEHEKLKQEVVLARYKHSVVLGSERSCMTCHTAHGADLSGLMNDLPLNTCMTCHHEKQRTDRGYVVAALPELKDPTSIKHGPIHDGQCGACHHAHGADQPLFLVKSNNKSLYQKFVAENYELCFDCHDLKLGSEPQTHSATAFRNGDVNLHFLHANDGERGRNCRVCHSTHASHSPKHVNEQVRFGKWEMPIAFKATPTGGTCTPGCHRAYDYDREKPVVWPTTRPTTRPAYWASATRPYSAPQKPGRIDWTLTTVTGRAVSVPHATRPTLLLFTRAKHPQQSELFKRVIAALPDRARAEVVIFVGGPGAQADAERMNERKDVPWTIIADEIDLYFGRLQVHVWPTTVILNTDGSQAARISGVPDTLTLWLSAQLDYLNGRLTREALAERLRTRRTVGDTPERQIGKLISAARSLAQSGKLPEARALLTEALKEHPTAVPLKIELAKLLTNLGPDALTEAATLLDAVSPAEIGLDEHDLLRARLYLKQRKYDPARQTLARVIKRTPTCREAHYLLGLLAETTGDTAAAAKHYRLASQME